MQKVTTIGLDIAKSVFQVHGIDAEGTVLIRRQLKRRYVLAFFENLQPCLVGIEACATSHHWSRELTALGHTVRLMPPAYVKPYVRRRFCSKELPSFRIRLDFTAEESVHAPRKVTAVSPPLPPSPGLFAGLWAVEVPASGRRATMEAAMPKTQTSTPKLTDTQLVILSGAAQRGDHALIPFPQSLAVRGAALDKVIETLRKRNLIEERRIVDGAPEWRRDEENRAHGLFITTSGLLALGIEEADKERPSLATAGTPRKSKVAANPRRKPQTASPSDPRRRSMPTQTKQDQVIQMLRRQSGVSIDDIIAKTGWQPHSVRGFFSGLVRKKLNLPLVSDVGKDGVRRYQIVSVASSKA
jgi:Protein of unknown function (DUF3489)